MPLIALRTLVAYDRDLQSMKGGGFSDVGEVIMAEMFNPSHPGLTLRDDVLPALRLSVDDAARQLDVDPATLAAVLNGQTPITAEMALRIEAWLGMERGGSARVWLAEQNAYDLWQARQRLFDAPLNVQRAPAEVRAPRKRKKH